MVGGIGLWIFPVCNFKPYLEIRFYDVSCPRPGQMYDACNEVVKDNFSLSWEKCVSNSFDNTNSMAGAHESLLKKKKTPRVTNDVGCVVI